jgi:hypothetical protein
MMETNNSVVVEGSVASRRSSFGGDEGLFMVGLSAFAVAGVEGEWNVRISLKRENVIVG